MTGSSSGAAPGWAAYLDALAMFGMKPGLERVEALLARLDHPERRFRSIHVVGTNGKSSTTRYAAAILGAHGARSGAYLSPHITGYAERVLVDGRPVADEVFGEAVELVREQVRDLPEELGETTQFEVLTVAALLVFAREGVEAAAVEAGLGGRLDATNVLSAPVVVLTNIGLEHTDVLGDTREQIFAEKAAVIGSGADAVFGDLDGLEPLAEQACREVGARARLLGREIEMTGGPDDFAVRIHGSGEAGGAGAEYSGLAVPSRAIYQAVNAALAVAGAHYLLGGLETEATRRGLAATAVPGRLQLVRRAPVVLADGAHNPHGTAALVASLEGVTRPRPRVALLSILRDKAYDEMLELLVPLAERIVCTCSSEPRSLAPEELAERTVAAGATPEAVEAISAPVAAYRRALALAGREGSVLVTGSLYLLEELAAELSEPPGARVY